MKADYLIEFRVGVFNCFTCGNIYRSKQTLVRHIKYECQQAPRFKCDICSYKAKLNCNLLKHLRSKHHRTNSRRNSNS
ncbi:hypothetical protein NQ317_014980 [Molorchus minor]|uniref:C2H2-type domain-containing protein n=1 Tax=Molorchus minor TaxID=1323400 RepID=A0ABQ9JD23_9CUCU|nr:hypothetical protein NQ317_014980 [Molorchus minor]